MDTENHSDEIVLLKRTIRLQLNMAVRHGRIDGDEALGVMASLLAEMVAKVKCDRMRNEIISDIVTKFPAFVMLEREVPNGVTWQ